AAVRGHLYARNSVAARDRQRGARDDLPGLSVHAAPPICAVRTGSMAASLWELLASRTDLVGLLHDRDDRNVIGDRGSGAREDRGHHLDPAILAAASKIAGHLRRLERFSPVVAPVHWHVPFDLRVLPVVPPPASGKSMSMVEGLEVVAS